MKQESLESWDFTGWLRDAGRSGITIKENGK